MMTFKTSRSFRIPFILIIKHLARFWFVAVGQFQSWQFGAISRPAAKQVHQVKKKGAAAVGSKQRRRKYKLPLMAEILHQLIGIPSV